MERIIEGLNHYCPLYIQYIIEGEQGDLLRGQIHAMIVHLFEKELGMDVEYKLNRIVHNLLKEDDLEYGMDVIEILSSNPKKYETRMKKQLLDFYNEYKGE